MDARYADLKPEPVHSRRPEIARSVTATKARTAQRTYTPLGAAADKAAVAQAVSRVTHGRTTKPVKFNASV